MKNDLKRKIENLKSGGGGGGAGGGKALPGRQISDVSLKKAGLDASDKSARKKRSSRSRSNSSASSYGSSDSKSNLSNDESDSFSDDEGDDYRKKASKKPKVALDASFLFFCILGLFFSSYYN